jgi:hypothetical protein
MTKVLQIMDWITWCENDPVDQTVIPENFWKDKQKSKARVIADKQIKN